MVSLAVGSSYLAILASAGSLIALVVAAWAILLPRLAVGFLFFSLVFGQIIRLPLPGQGGGLLLSDVAVVLVLAATLTRILKGKLLTRNGVLPTLSFLPFLLWSLWGLIIQIPGLGTTNTLVASSYWLRLASNLLLLPALLILFSDKALRTFARHTLVASITLLIVLGFVQILIFPSLSRLPSLEFGIWNLEFSNAWDPHQSRLVSTWLDPNFFGGFLVLTMPFIIGYQGESRRKALLAGLLIAELLALALTQSRTSLLALGGTVFLFAPFVVWRYIRKRRFDGAVTVVTVSLLLANWLAGTAVLLGERLPGFWQFDPTVAMRFESLRTVWNLVEENTWLGVGYNAYQFAALREGLIGDFTIHSRAGADNSVLTLWVTSGLPGVLLFFSPWLAFGGIFFHRWLLYGSLFALAATAAIVALLLHSQFVNSFLYSHLLIVLVVIVSLALSATKSDVR